MHVINMVLGRHGLVLLFSSLWIRAHSISETPEGFYIQLCTRADVRYRAVKTENQDVPHFGISVPYSSPVMEQIHTANITHTNNAIKILCTYTCRQLISGSLCVSY